MIEPSGRAQLVEAGKHAIMRRACLPARDLRILDPLLSYPSTILGRERAIVVNLEHIKAIITAQEVLLLNSMDPVVKPVVVDLKRRLPLHYNALGEQVGNPSALVLFLPLLNCSYKCEMETHSLPALNLTVASGLSNYLPFCKQ
jgi:hypothetical protein